jgi:RNA polymerase sigma-70 factor (ECF subfamily)
MGIQPQIENSLLVLQSQEGDAEAFTILVLRWRDRLWNHARRLTGDDAAADDVLQDTWAAVIKGLPRLDDVDAFPKWAFQIVTFKCRDWIRKQQRRRWLHLEFLRESRKSAVPRTANVPDDLNGAIAALSEKHRAVVSLHYFEGFGVNEIAQMLSVPPGTVKSRLAEARDRIRANMEIKKNELERHAEKDTR